MRFPYIQFAYCKICFTNKFKQGRCQVETYFKTFDKVVNKYLILDYFMTVKFLFATLFFTIHKTRGSIYFLLCLDVRNLEKCFFSRLQQFVGFTFTKPKPRSPSDNEKRLYPYYCRVHRSAIFP